MAAGDTMSENRKRSLTAVLPRMEEFFDLKLLRNQLAEGTTLGFLTKREISTIFAERIPADQLRVLFDILKGKSNAVFDRFCAILEKNKYENWSRKLKLELTKGMVERIGNENLRELFYIKGVKTDSHYTSVLSRDGTFGEVRKATWHSHPCVIKSFDITKSSKAEMRLESEAYLWALNLRHPNIVQFYGLWEEESSGTQSIVMEQLVTDLEKFLIDHKMQRYAIPLNLKRSILLDVCRGMSYLNRQNIIHRNLKASNILLSSSLVAKVSNFSKARLCQPQQLSTIIDDNHIAPEVSSGKYGLKVDVFSYGVVIMYIIIHEPPKPDPSLWGKSPYQQREAHVIALDLAQYEELPELMKKSLEAEPEDRPTFDEIEEKLTAEGKSLLSATKRYEYLIGDLQTLYEKKEHFEEERKRWEADVARLEEDNATFREALNLDRQANFLMKLYEGIEKVDRRISEDVQSGVKSMYEDIRKMTDQLPNTESKIALMENEKISLTYKLAAKEEEVKQLTKKLEDFVRTVQSKKKEEEELLIDRVREEMKEQQMSMLKEQQLSMMKELLAELKGPSQDVLPPSDTVKGEEVDVEKEKLRAQVEDLQKQLKEKTIVKQAEGDDTADKEMLQKQVEHLQKKLDEKEKDLTAVSQVEQTLRDTLSAERGRVEELQNETAGMKLQTQDLSQQLSQSKECIKALENILNNLVLRDKMADKVSNDVGNVCEAEDLGALAHEAELEKLCWIPFGIQTLTVGEEGGLFPLQPQTTEVYKDNDVIALEVPEGAVNTAVCDRLCIQYGVIVYGPFDLPEGYQLCSMAVYIYFNQDHAVKPVVLHLPHWSGKDGESGLKCIVAPHRLEEGEENYKFKDVEEGDFQSTEGCCLITIDGHCSLFAVALKKETSLKYYATGHERYDEKGTHLDVVITYASQVWLEILQKYRCPVSCSVLFEFAHSQIEGSVRPASGPGWTSWRDKNHVVQQEDIQFKSHGITSPKHLEGAVKRKAYPPFISCRTTYSKKLRKKGQPTHAVLLIEGAKDKPMEFLCSAYGYTLADNISVPVGSGYTVNISDSAYSSLSTASTNTRTINVAKAVNLRLASHEAELEKLCWIPFGIQTLTVGEEGGLFPLQPQTTEAYEDNDVIALEVPEGAINTAVCDRLCIRYGVIIHGPFDLPEGYQPVSVAVYIYFNQDHAVKPVVLHLPHWSRKDGESGLKGVVAPHRLEEGEEKYKFKVVEEGDFQSREGRGIISVHSACTLFTLIFKKDAKSKYYATPVEKTGKEGSNLQVIFTYFSEVWLKLLDEYHSPGLYSVPFEFSSGKIQGHLEATQGRGWRAHIVGSGVTTEEQCLYEYSGYENGRDLEAAVQRGIYPPMIVCRTEYGHALQKTGNPTKAGLVLKGIQKGILRFLLTTYEYTSQERHIPIGTETVSMVTPPRRNVQMSIAQALPPKKTINPSKELSMQKLMPYIPDLAPCGQEIARYLGLSTVWASIEISLKDPPGRLQELLTKWLDDSEQKTSPHTWEFFVDVVRKVGKGKLADRIAEEIL